MRWAAFIAVALVVAVALGACSGKDTGGAIVGGTSASTRPPRLGHAELTFTGAVAGAMALDTAPNCRPSGTGVLVDIEGTVSGRRLGVTVVEPSSAGTFTPGSVTAGSVTLTDLVEPTREWTATGGTVVLGDGTGRIDAPLAPSATAPTGTQPVHVTGTWTCP